MSKVNQTLARHACNHCSDVVTLDYDGLAEHLRDKHGKEGFDEVSEYVEECGIDKYKEEEEHGTTKHKDEEDSVVNMKESDFAATGSDVEEADAGPEEKKETAVVKRATETGINQPKRKTTNHFRPKYPLLMVYCPRCQYPCNGKERLSMHLRKEHRGKKCYQFCLSTILSVLNSYMLLMYVHNICFRCKPP